MGRKKKRNRPEEKVLDMQPTSGQEPFKAKAGADAVPVSSLFSDAPKTRETSKIRDSSKSREAQPKSQPPEKTRASSRSKNPKLQEATKISPPLLEQAKKPSQLATYLLCGLMFTAGVLAQKTFDRWKARQELSLKRTKTEQGRVTEIRSAKPHF